LSFHGDDFDPIEFAELVGLTATKMLKKGSKGIDPPFPRLSFWEFSGEEVENDVIDVYELSENLVSHLSPFTSKFIEGIKKFNLTCTLSVVLWIDRDESKSTPAIGFESGVIAFLNEIGGTIDVDTYLY
jgi:hypothetical protein